MIRVAVGLIVLAAAPFASAQEKKSTTQQQFIFVPSGQVGAQPGGKTATVQFVASVGAGKYWLGLHLAPVSGALRSHLGLDEGKGLIVETVVAKSPSHEKLEVNDILIRAGETEITDIASLRKAIDAVEEKPLEVTVLRKGKETKVTVTPAKRPQTQGQFVFQQDLDTVTNYLHNIEKHDGPFGARVRVIRPPVWVGQSPNGLPKNLKISVQRQGGQPAKIEVEKDGKKFSVTEKQLDQLPEDIREHVRRSLGQGNASGAWMRWTSPRIGAPHVQHLHQQIHRHSGGSVTDQLNHATQQMEHIQKLLNEIRQRIDAQGGTSSPPKDKPVPPQGNDQSGV